MIDFSAAEFSGAIEEEYIPAGSEEVIMPSKRLSSTSPLE